MPMRKGRPALSVTLSEAKSLTTQLTHTQRESYCDPGNGSLTTQEKFSSAPHFRSKRTGLEFFVPASQLLDTPSLPNKFRRFPIQFVSQKHMFFHAQAPCDKPLKFRFFSRLWPRLVSAVRSVTFWP